MLPLFTQPHIFAMPLPSNEKSLTLNGGFGKSDLLWSFEPKNLCRKKFTHWLAVAFKNGFLYSYEEQKRDRSVPL